MLAQLTQLQISLPWSLCAPPFNRIHHYPFPELQPSPPTSHIQPQRHPQVSNVGLPTPGWEHSGSGDSIFLLRASDSSNALSFFLPQGLCTCCLSCLECSPSVHLSIAHQAKSSYFWKSLKVISPRRLSPTTRLQQVSPLFFTHSTPTIS